jgi:hypothetical protein
MNQAMEALKIAMEFEDIAKSKLEAVIEIAAHQDTKDAINKMVEDKNKQIEAIQWLIMAESGKLDVTEQKEGGGMALPANGAERMAQGKCPFSSGELAKMGINVSEDDLKKKKPKPE